MAGGREAGHRLCGDMFDSGAMSHMRHCGCKGDHHARAIGRRNRRRVEQEAMVGAGQRRKHGKPNYYRGCDQAACAILDSSAGFQCF